jgi:hypothetical protein
MFSSETESEDKNFFADKGSAGGGGNCYDHCLTLPPTQTERENTRKIGRKNYRKRGGK